MANRIFTERFPDMNSCLYRATVMHNRLSPRPHRFHYGIFMFYIDLDEIGLLREKLLLFSIDRFNMFSLRNAEHLQLPIDKPDRSRTIRQHITDYIRQNGVQQEPARIMLLTNLNVMGYNFNPVSFYFCFDAGGAPICSVAEVCNTFGEMKPFFLGKEQLAGDRFSLNTTKHFYVSPFIDHDTIFDFQLNIPGDKLNIRIDDRKDGERFFISTLTGTRKPLSNFNLFLYSLRFPLVTLKIISLIHWNALLLWLKKLPYHKKDANPHLQKDVYRRYKS